MGISIDQWRRAIGGSGGSRVDPCTRGSIGIRCRKQTQSIYLLFGNPESGSNIPIPSSAPSLPNTTDSSLVRGVLDDFINPFIGINNLLSTAYGGIINSPSATSWGFHAVAGRDPSFEQVQCSIIVGCLIVISFLAKLFSNSRSCRRVDIELQQEDGDGRACEKVGTSYDCQNEEVDSTAEKVVFTTMPEPCQQTEEEDITTSPHLSPTPTPPVVCDVVEDEDAKEPASCWMEPLKYYAFSIQVRSVTGSWMMRLRVSEFDSVLDIKKMIRGDYKAMPSQQRMNFKGVMLDDDRKLMSYGIRDGCVVYVSLPFRAAGNLDSDDDSDDDVKFPARSKGHEKKRKSIIESSSESEEDEEEGDDVGKPPAQSNASRKQQSFDSSSDDNSGEMLAAAAGKGLNDNNSDTGSDNSIDEYEVEKIVTAFEKKLAQHDPYSDDEFEDEEDEISEETQDDVQFTRYYLRNDRVNKDQANCLDNVLKHLKNKIPTALIKKGELFLPCSENESQFNLEKRMLQYKSTSAIYYIYSSQKSGRCTNGVQRYKYYETVNESGEKIIILFDYDYACNQTINETLPQVLKEVSELEGVSLKDDDKDTKVNLETLDIDGACALEQNGLSFFVRLVIDSIVSELDGLLGGADTIQGFIRAFDLNNVESAIQLYLRELDRDINPSTSTEQHEHLHCNALEWIKAANIEVQQKVEEFFRLLIEEVDDDWVSGINIQNIKFRSSWAPDIKHNDAAATCVAYDAITGEKNILSDEQDDRCKNMFKERCSYNNPETNKKEPYNSGEFYDNGDRREVRDEHSRLLTEHKNEGGLLVLDRCNEAYSDVDTSLVDIAKSQDYEPFFDYKGLTAWVHKDNKSSVLIIHPPLCDIFFSSAETEAVSSWHKIQPQGEKAKLAHLLQAIIQNIDTGADEIKTNRNVMGNFLFAFAMRIYLLKNLHLHSFVATLFAKNMVWQFGNLFETEYHGLAASTRGANKRQQSRNKRKEDNGDDIIFSDMWQLQAMQNDLSVSDNILKVVERLCSVPLEDGSSKPREFWNDRLRLYNMLMRKYLVEKRGTLGKRIYDALKARQDREDDDKASRNNLLVQQTGAEFKESINYGGLK